MIAARIVCLIICIFFLIISTGCLAPVSPAHALPGQSWKLVSYNYKGRMTSPDPNVTIVIQFGPAGLISGSIGCKSYWGTYDYEGEILSFNNIGSTARNCDAPGGTVELEDYYIRLLENTTRFSVAQDTLTFSYFDEKKLLVFERQSF